jgi:hypothetical protein
MDNIVDQSVLYIRPSPEEKELIEAAAAAERLSTNQFVLKAVLDHIGAQVKPGERCAHCGRPLAKPARLSNARRNKSGFCRHCLRSVGIETLTKLHHKEHSDGKPQRAARRAGQLKGQK